MCSKDARNIAEGINEMPWSQNAGLVFCYRWKLMLISVDLASNCKSSLSEGQLI